ncbi:hypothetical protein E4U55_000439 [Claviceps digitariae]|nr:hypothetical protein E4U55_000439 [Claviceps digitariae]
MQSWYATRLQENHSDHILEQIRADRTTGRFCDLEIVCGENRFKAHRIIEAASGVFEFKETSAVYVGRILDYMYTGDYQLPQAVSDGSGQDKIDSPIEFHARMMGLADMYMVPGLAIIAKSDFKEAVAKEEKDCTFLDCIPTIYDIKIACHDEVREIIIDSTRQRITPRPLAQDVNERLDDLMAKLPEFTRDLLKSYIRSPVLDSCSSCGGDKKVTMVPTQCRCQECGQLRYC